MKKSTLSILFYGIFALPLFFLHYAQAIETPLSSLFDEQGHVRIDALDEKDFYNALMDRSTKRAVALDEERKSASITELKKDCLNHDADGCFVAGNRIAMMLVDAEKKIPIAIEYYKKACDFGQLDACAFLRDILLNGVAGNKNIREAGSLVSCHA